MTTLLSNVEEENVIDEVLFTELDVNTTWLKSKTWLTNIRAEIESEKPYESIKAFHLVKHYYDENAHPRKRSKEGPKIDWSKNIVIETNQEGQKTKIHVIIDPPYKKEPWHNFKGRRKIWLKFVGDLANYLGIRLDRTQLKYYYQDEYYRNTAVFHVFNILGFGALLLFLNWIYYPVPNSKWYVLLFGTVLSLYQIGKHGYRLFLLWSDFCSLRRMM